ncbi:MAG TPA: thioredoxin domain-containing protein [Novosphingobium sp.]|nr:thioredoxin domain-containing protein [Novosphingobium sp.]
MTRGKNALLWIAALGSALPLAVAAAPKTVAWSNTVTLGANGSHMLGNPEAGTRLVEYNSYTCPHCARYNLQSEGVLRLAYIPSGKISVEVRQFPLNPIDVAAAMLAACGPKEKFFLNHTALLRSQEKWAAPISYATGAQQARWKHPDLGTRNRAIASDLHLYDVMETRGYDRQTLERCLTDKTEAARIEAQRAAAEADGVVGTPSFSINGKLLLDTNDWASLRPQLDESLR